MSNNENCLARGISEIIVPFAAKESQKNRKRIAITLNGERSSGFVANVTSEKSAEGHFSLASFVSSVKKRPLDIVSLDGDCVIPSERVALTNWISGADGGPSHFAEVCPRI
ncbi:hypothetical protein WN48_07370 [Eufriesea mexicana]|nr:hypothetical protein WN48_07370 [Eufriesea mexicana]